MNDDAEPDGVAARVDVEGTAYASCWWPRPAKPVPVAPEEGVHLGPDAWELVRAVFVGQEPYDRRKLPCLHEGCKVLLPRMLWHCPGCHEHWSAATDVCEDCGIARPLPEEWYLAAELPPCWDRIISYQGQRYNRLSRLGSLDRRCRQ